MRRLWLIASVFVFCALPARGEEDELAVTDGSTPLALEPGAPAGAFPLSGFETVNLYNGNLNFRLPLLAITGRGDARMTMTLPIERRWTVRKRGGSHEVAISYQVEGDSWSPLKPGYGPGVLGTRKAVQEVQKNAQGQITKQRSVTRFTFTAPDGTETEFRDQALDGEPKIWRHGLPSINRGTVFNATDGSAATFLSDLDVLDAVGASTRGKAHEGRILWRNGTEYRIGNGLVGGRGLVHSMRDRNGNIIRASPKRRAQVAGRRLQSRKANDRQVWLGGRQANWNADG
jgi:hypothetical protein